MKDPNLTHFWVFYGPKQLRIKVTFVKVNNMEDSYLFSLDQVLSAHSPLDGDFQVIRDGLMYEIIIDALGENNVRKHLAHSIMTAIRAS